MFLHEFCLNSIFSGILQAGLDTVEFWLETPSFWTTGRNISDLKNVLDEFPSFSPITIHAPTLDLNPISINPEVAAVSVDAVSSAIQTADELRAEVITIHPGRRTAKRPPSRADMHRFAIYMEAVEAASCGLSAAVAIENMEPKINSLLTTPGAIRDVLDEYPHLFFTFDYAHACRGGGDVLEFIRLNSDRIRNVHASYGSSDRVHAPLAGSEKMGELTSLLASSGYDGPVIFEIEDLGLSKMLTYEEKCRLLSLEVDSFWKAWHKGVDLSL
ncbi:MAG: Xylose isomerase domain-containing protein TIM barrel [Methanomicrobiales archaeon 53_19]|jgi:sugar phosphate isomerase/epimerase|uniref:sugar phosphate isomerase/epimerase family protein n=1 Tax=Methanocalculus sp. TaxID=2004547 RepID=UPI00074686EE|nr:sugar phosphate isomerase/epimerase family protein [Methanocalculus sp.]KUK69754.1 MAG: Xylose isomerase domain-containing protein TIM barrel [Methanocalculus sp. 52_23]KUL04831.1 MAG: Xylose isomerase domain-containing protein TIM barrel [Methanomicrobiales archaeon 53_19]